MEIKLGPSVVIKLADDIKVVPIKTTLTWSVDMQQYVITKTWAEIPKDASA